MANIRVNIEYPIRDGGEVVFKAPCDFSDIVGLKVCYLKENQMQEFKFVDAHTNDVTGVAELFKKDAIVKVILDTENSVAFMQNADTNAYLEGKFEDVDSKLEVIDSKNYIINSHLLKLTGTDQSENYATGVTTIEDEAVKLVPAKDGNMYVILDNVLTETLKVGETYTFSVDILTTNDVGFQCTIGKYFTVSAKASDEWQRVSHTFVQTKETRSATLQIATVKAGETYYYKNFKLERGKVATDWVPTDKDYRDITIPITGWSTTAPFTLEINVANITRWDNPNINPVYSTTVTTALAQKEAWNCIDEITTSDGKITCKCFYSTPVTAIPIRIS